MTKFIGQVSEERYKLQISEKLKQSTTATVNPVQVLAVTRYLLI